MRFTVRPGSDPIASADPTLLAAMGLPGGGVIALGSTHVLVRPAEVPEATAILLGPVAMANARVMETQVVDATRAILPHAQRIVIAGEDLPASPKEIIAALHGTPVTPGDRLVIDASYVSGAEADIFLDVVEMKPAKAATVGVATVIVAQGSDRPDPPAGQRRHAGRRPVQPGHRYIHCNR